MVTSPTHKFITVKDTNELIKHDINCDRDIEIFIIEMKNYFNDVWCDESGNNQWDIEVDTIEEFNTLILSNYPSWPGYHILDDAFTGPDCPVYILSENSKIILGYLYGIQLRY